MTSEITPTSRDDKSITINKTSDKKVKDGFVSKLRETHTTCEHRLQLVPNEDLDNFHVNWNEDIQKYTVSNDDDMMPRCHIQMLCVGCGKIVSVQLDGVLVHHN